MQSFRDAPICPGIYVITNILNGKRYVGQSDNVRQRWYSHRSDLNAGRSGCKRLLAAWKHYGEDAFAFSVLVTLDSTDDLDAWEQWFIDALVPEYNTSKRAGTRRGVPQPLDAIARTTAKVQGKPKSLAWRVQARERRLGMKFPPEWCENIRRSKQHVSAETRALQSDAQKAAAARRNAQLSGVQDPMSIEAQPRRGRKLSIEHRLHISQGQLGNKRGPETSAKLSAVHTGRKQTPEQIAKRVAKNTGKKRTRTQRATMSAAVTAWHAARKAAQHESGAEE